MVFNSRSLEIDGAKGGDWRTQFTAALGKHCQLQGDAQWPQQSQSHPQGHPHKPSLVLCPTSGELQQLLAHPRGHPQPGQQQLLQSRAGAKSHQMLFRRTVHI